MSNDTTTLLSLFGLAQLADSTLPVGSFSFSLGLEGAIEAGMVGTIGELEEYTIGALYGAAECDCIALLEAFRSGESGDYARVIDADLRLMSYKSASEQRSMTLRMGHRLADLLRSIAPSSLSNDFYDWIRRELTPGSYPIAQAIAGLTLGVEERGLYAAHLYGVAQTILSASLRLMRITHFDTQRILRKLAPLCERLYNHYGELTLEDMTSWSPSLSLAASLHEKGSGRLFMN
ncbi:MAG: urease accessory protein UreF [Tidjanibacter sp.]|nr:urease accessory protein UreF [Tidjanibacter sp.]